MSSPSLSTIKRLFAVSGNRCAFPNCPLPLIDEASKKVTARICHIKARQQGGPRYDPNQSDAERHSDENLLLLCPIHHDVIDSDVLSYTVGRLLEIKHKHENTFTRREEPNDQIAEALLATITSNNFSGSAIVVGQNQAGSQTAHQITNVSIQSDLSIQFEQEISKRRDSHDLEIFKHSDSLLNEDQLLLGISRLLAEHAYFQDFRISVSKFCDFFSKVRNQYLNVNLASLSCLLVESLDELLDFLAIHFFNYPIKQSGENIRYCLYPDLCVDRSGSGSPEEMAIYGKHVDHLDDLADKVRAAYKAYRKAIKETLVI